MKKMIVSFVAVICLFSLANAGGGDASIITKSVKGSQTQIFPWVTYDTGQFELDVRSNFDWTDASGMFIGKSFAKGGITILPEVGLIKSNLYSAVSPEFMAYGGNKKIFLMTLNQLAFGTKSAYPSFGYHWVEALWKADDRIQVGLGEQVFWLFKGTHPQLDIGPVVKVSGPLATYLKLWGTYNPDTVEKKFFVTVGTGL